MKNVALSSRVVIGGRSCDLVVRRLMMYDATALGCHSPALPSMAMMAGISLTS